MAASLQQAEPGTGQGTARPRRRRGPGLFRIGEDIPRGTYLGIAAASFLIPLALWCFFTYTGRANALILPTPTDMLKARLDEFRDGTLMPDVRISVYRIGMGFLLSAVLAIPIGILMGAYKTAEAAHEPFVGFIRYVPVPALIPLVMVTAGIDEPAKILLIFIGTYFQMGAGGRRRYPSGAPGPAPRGADAGRQPRPASVQRAAARDPARPAGTPAGR